MSMKRSPEWYADYQRKNELRKAQSIGNCEPISLGDVGHAEAVTFKPNKFRNVKTDGYASKREANRAAQLRLMQSAGLIRELREQVRYEIVPEQDGERAAHYIADFVYQRAERVADDLGLANIRWETVVEDAKGVRTAEYILKRKLMQHVHAIRISEV